MTMQEIYEQFLTDIGNTTWLEYVAVIAGIASVWFSRLENTWVYPTGLVNTIFYIYLSIKGHLYGEASVNFYYTVMSIYGWILWARKDQYQRPALAITFSTSREWVWQLAFFTGFYTMLFFALQWLKASFAAGAIPWADAFASATAYTGMWLMARKKVESWYWWLATNIASVPLYFVKHYVFTSVYYIVLFIMAVFGLIEWIKRAKRAAV